MKLVHPLILPLVLAPAAAVAQVSNPNQTFNVANLSPPAVGQTATDPTFGVTVRRLTDRGSNGGLATAEYPQLQAVNSDETRILVSTDQGFSIFDIASLDFTHDLPQISLPRWSPIEADVIIGFNQRSGGNIDLQRYELMGNGMVMVTTLVDVSALGFDSLEQGSWEDLSDDGRYVGLYGDRNGTTTAAVLDIMAGAIRGSVAVSNVDWVAVSPSGQYLAVQYVNRGVGNTDGLVIFDAANGARLGHAADHHEHGDLGRDGSGADIFMTLAYTDFCAGGNVPCCTMAPLPNAVETDRLNHLYELNAGIYSSCRNHQRPGFCLHSDDFATAGQTPFAQELWLTRLSDGAVLRLFHHRTSACSYYNYTRPTVSPTGRYVLFTSDWAAPNCSDQGDLYLIDTQPFLDNFLGGTPPPVDAGFPDSGFVPADSGVPFPDVGFDDGGLPIDANIPDTGFMAADAGPGIDATGTDLGRRDGTSNNNNNNNNNDGDVRGGCGCSATPMADGSGPWVTASMLTLLMFRRRR